MGLEPTGPEPTQREPGAAQRIQREGLGAHRDGEQPSVLHPELSRIDLAHRREGDVLSRSQSGRRSGLQTLKVLRDEDTIVAARACATGLLAGDPDLLESPMLAVAVAELEQSRQSEFMEKS